MPGENQTTYSYSAQGLLVSISRPDGSEEHFKYDSGSTQIHYYSPATLFAPPPVAMTNNVGNQFSTPAVAQGA